MLENITRNVCMDVIKEEDNHILDLIKQQSQMIVATILSDTKKSPFLNILHSDRSSESILSSCTSNLTRCIQVLLASSSDVIDTRAFILSCFSRTPKLFISHLKFLTVPEAKPSFSCISSYALIAYMLDRGPCAWNCSDDELKDLTAEKVVLQIVPRGLTKNVLTKTLQTSNALLLFFSAFKI